MGQGQVVAGEKEKIDTKSVSPSFFIIKCAKAKGNNIRFSLFSISRYGFFTLEISTHHRHPMNIFENFSLLFLLSLRELMLLAPLNPFVGVCVTCKEPFFGKGINFLFLSLSHCSFGGAFTTTGICLRTEPKYRSENSMCTFPKKINLPFLLFLPAAKPSGPRAV